MTIRLAPLAILVLALGGTSPALAEEGGWTQLGYADSRHPAPDGEQGRLDATWRDQVVGAKFARYLFGTVELTDGRKATVSLAQTVQLCEAAANAETDTDSVPVCPVVVSVTGPDGTKTARGTACFSAALLEDDPKVIAENGTEVSVAGTELRLRAKADGKYPKDCETSLPLPG